MDRVSYIQALRGQCESEEKANSLGWMGQFFTDEQNEVLLTAAREIAVELRRDELKSHYGECLEDPGPEGYGVEIMEQRFSELATVFKQANLEPPLLHFATLPIGTLNAMTLVVPDSGERVIVFNDGLFVFLNSLTKILLTSVHGAREVTALLDAPRFPGDVGDLLMLDNAIPPEARTRFHDLLASYIFRGDAGESLPWLLPTEFMSSQAKLLEASEIFILAHECGHLQFESHPQYQSVTDMFRHLGDMEIQVVARQHFEELFADGWAGITTLSVLISRTDVKLMFAGIEMFFMATEIIEKALSVLRGGVVSPDPTHPPATDRLESLRTRIVKKLGPQAYVLFRTADSFAWVMNDLWESELAYYQQMHAKGVKAAPLWNALV